MRIVGALSVAAAMLVVSGANAQQTSRPEAKALSRGADPTNIIKVRPGYGTVIALDRSFKTISVGDPDLIDAVAETDRAVILRAKRESGATNLVIIGEAAEVIYSATIIVSSGSIRVYLGSPKAGTTLEPRSFSCTEVDCVRTDKPPPTPNPIIMLPGMPIGAAAQ